ncbi:MAG: glycoside hydrolase family 3 protein [Clostridiales bacterium]|nr:glycoside hydrolase family 3 protein [Clostridiales bacterium]
MVDLKKEPFSLSDSDVMWVEETLSSMTLEEKAGQVFCPMGFTSDENVLRHLVCEVGVGGLMYRADSAANIRKTHETIQNLSKIPLLLAANTEAGGDGLAFEGTSFGQPMAVAATDDPENAYRMGYVAAKEGAALGLNWSFAPIVDIDLEFHNPITNVRTFGSDPDRVIANASRYMDGARENGVAVAIKHFPGDGVDERDQHILTSVNSLSTDEWDRTYGKVYSTLIAKGAQTVMAGHIAQPAYVAALKPDATDEEKLLPASLNPVLLTGLLRKKLRFNGLICTDSTPMVGFTAAMPRAKAIPSAIAAGADMILFNKDLEEDFGFLMAGLKNGILSVARLDEAVTRILGTKAALGLHKKKSDGTLVPGEERLGEVGCAQHRAWAEEVAEKSITLVRDKQNLLPISPAKYKRVYLNAIQKDMSPENPVVTRWKELFEKEGFEVTVRDRRVGITVQDYMTDQLSPEKAALMHEMYRSVGEARNAYDLYVYICNMENASNNTTLRLNWNVAFGLGDDAPWLVQEVPVLMISTAYPYHLFDAPMVKTYINAYSTRPDFCEAVMERIMGRAAFTGVSPVDPFCGKEYLK